MNIRYIILIILSILFWRHGYAQYPTAGTKQRLGYQTTGDGLVFRGNGAPAYTPTGLNNAWTYLDTVSRNIYTYVGGTWQLITGGGSAFDGYVDSLVFNQSATVVPATGKMYWDANSETISVGVDGGAVYQMGEELYYPIVINKSGATILNGQLVMVDTATLVTGDHVRIILARNGATYPSSYIMGVATTDIPNDSTGLVTWFGYVREVKHADIAQTGVTLVPGNILYASATEPGRYTNVAPASPAHKSTIALVVRKPSDNNMTLLVRPWLAPRLADLSDVNTSSVTGLSVLRYNSTTGIWDASATPGIVAADTAAMLSPYLRKVDTTAMLLPYLRKADTTAMLSPYLRKVDTLSLSNRINLKLSIADTTAMLLPYAKDTDVTLKLNIADTAAMLVPYQKDITLTTTGTSGAATFNGVTLNVPQYQAALTNPVTGTGTAGQVSYWSNTGVQTGNINFTWDNSKKAVVLNDGTNYAVLKPTSDGVAITGESNGTLGWAFSNTTIKNLYGNYVNIPSKLKINGTGDPNISLYVDGRDAIRIPVGTTAQRPTGAAGAVRYNSELADLEFHNGTSWQELQAAITNPITGTGIATYIPQFNGTNSLTWTNAVYTSNRWGFNTASPSVLVDINGQARVRTLGTGSITRLTGADADGVLGAVTLGTGLSISAGTLNATANGIQNFSINIFNAGIAVINTTSPANFFLVPANLNGYCIDSYQVKALSGTGTADVQIGKNGSGFFAQSISGTTTYNVNTNISLATGDIIQGNVSNLSAGATLTGLGLTIEIKATCN